MRQARAKGGMLRSISIGGAAGEVGGKPGMGEPHRTKKECSREGVVIILSAAYEYENFRKVHLMPLKHHLMPLKQCLCLNVGFTFTSQESLFK